MKVFAIVLVFLATSASARPSESSQADAPAPAAGYGAYFGGLLDNIVKTATPYYQTITTKATPYYQTLANNAKTAYGAVATFYTSNIGPQVNTLAQYYSDNLGPIINPWLQSAQQAVQPYVSVLVQSAQQYTSDFITYLTPYVAAGAKGTQQFLTSLQEVMQQQIKNAGPMSLNLLTKLVSNTIQFAVSNGILEAEAGNRLLATFAPKDQGITAEPLTQADMDTLKVTAIEGAASNFISSVKALLDSKTEESSPYALLGGLEAALMELLAAQSIIDAKGAISTMSAVGLSKMQEAFSASLNYLSNLKNQIVQSETVQQIAQKAPEVVDKAVHYVADLSNQFAQSEIAQQTVQKVQELLEQTPELYNSSLNYAYELKDQMVQSELVQQLAQKAPEVYASYKASVEGMISQLKESDAYKQVAEQAPQYKDAFISTMSNVVNQMAQNKIVQLTMQKAPEYYTASLNLLSSLKDQLVTKAPEVYNNLNAALQAKLAAGGQLTKAGLVKALQGLLGLSANQLLKQEDANRLAAALGAETGVEALKVEEVETLEIVGNAQVATTLKESIKVALTAQEVTVSNLAAVNSALVSALAKNGYINGAAALGLNTIISA